MYAPNNWITSHNLICFSSKLVSVFKFHSSTVRNNTQYVRLTRKNPVLNWLKQNPYVLPRHSVAGNDIFFTATVLANVIGIRGTTTGLARPQQYTYFPVDHLRFRRQYTPFRMKFRFKTDGMPSKYFFDESVFGVDFKMFLITCGQRSCALESVQTVSPTFASTDRPTSDRAPIGDYWTRGPCASTTRPLRCKPVHGWIFKIGYDISYVVE